MSPEYTKLEAATREEIDKKLIAAGWVQDNNCINLKASLTFNVRGEARRTIDGALEHIEDTQNNITAISENHISGTAHLSLCKGLQ